MKTPGIIIEREGGQVRLRGMKYPLPVHLDIGSRVIDTVIKPNTWTKVPDEVYRFLQGRFDAPRHTTIPDVEANERNPHKPGESPVMTTEEVDPQFYLEFRK